MESKPDDGFLRARCSEHGEEVLKKLAEATGGRMLEVRGIDKLTTALEEISDELHHQYSLGYYPEKQNWDGKFRPDCVFLWHC